MARLSDPDAGPVAPPVLSTVDFWKTAQHELLIKVRDSILVGPWAQSLEHSAAASYGSTHFYAYIHTC